MQVPINKDNYIQIAEEIKNLLMCDSDVNRIIDKLLMYGIKLNKVLDGQKIVDLTFASFETEKFHKMLLEMANINLEETKDDGIEKELEYVNQNQFPQKDECYILNENGQQLLSQEEWEKALEELNKLEDDDE